MPHRTSPNAPYNLTTEHGRAQSFAHSAQGAFLAANVESAMLSEMEEVCSDLENLIDKEMAKLNPDCIVNADLLTEFSQFQGELGVRDREVFSPMLAAYIEERAAVRVDMQVLTKLVQQIRNLFDIDPT